MLGAGADSDSELSLVLYTRACISNLFTLPFLPLRPRCKCEALLLYT